MSGEVRGREVAGRGLDVGFVCQGWAPDAGGIESHTLDLARELARRGHRVHVLCLDGSEGREPYTVRDAQVDGVAVRRMAYRYHDHRALADVIENPRALDVVLAWMAEVPCDVIHVHHLTGFGAGALRAVREVSNPLVVSLHDYWLLCPRGQMLHVDGSLCREAVPERCGACIAATWPRLSIAGGAERRGPDGESPSSDAEAADLRTRRALACLEHAAALLVPSPAALEVFARHGVARERMQLCALATAAVARAGGERQPGELVLGMLGGAAPGKGALELAEALLAAAIPGLALEVHGPLEPQFGDARYLEALRALAARDARVRLRGPYAREHLPRLLAGLDGVAVPSRWEETWGIVAREARAAGLPVLVSDLGGLPEAAQSGRAGLAVAGDRAAWVAALRRFADPAERARWAQEPARLRTIAEMTDQIEAVYRAAIAATRDAARAPAAPGPRKGFFRRLLGG